MMINKGGLYIMCNAEVAPGDWSKLQSYVRLTFCAVMAKTLEQRHSETNYKL